MSNVQAISLWQPWATALALGSKRVETRHWSTKYRGPLVIHAAKRRVVDELIHSQCCHHWKGALQITRGDHKIWETLPFGALVAICDLVDCRPTDTFTVGELDTRRRAPGEASDLYGWSERMMGDFSPGRYGWILENIRPFDNPIPYRGSQGFFYVDETLLHEDWPDFGGEEKTELQQGELL